MDVPSGYQQITSLGTAVGLTVPAKSVRAYVQAEAQAVRWRDDGTNPTATVGMVLAAGTGMWVEARALSTIKFIETTAAAKLNVSYYKPGAR